MRRIGREMGQLAVVLGLLGSVAGSSMASADDKPQSESWDGVYIAGSKVGYMRTRVIPVKDGNRQLIRVLLDFKLSFKRGNNASTMEMQYGTIETPEGQVLRLDTRTYASQQTIRVHGDVIDGKMTLKIESGSNHQEQVIAWTPDTYGPYGAELSMSRTPLKPGETRKIKIFIPTLNRIGEALLTAHEPEPIELGEGAIRQLVRVDQDITVDGKRMPELNTTFWVEGSGQILKSFNDNNGGMVTYRTTKEAATRNLGDFNLLTASIVKVPRRISNPDSSRSVTYKLTMVDANPVDIFPNDRRQKIVAGSDSRTGLLEVKTAGKDVGEAGPEAVNPEYLRSNPMISCDDAKVIALSRQAVGKTTDPWAKAQAINNWVFKRMDKNFETGFAPADEVARTLQGDCTEHGVLTAAMCRAQGIPAKVVTGLVYVPDQGGFGFHMWNEVYINRRWVAIDSTWGETDVDAVHIKLSETSLDGVAPFETFLPVARTTSKLKIEVIETR